MERVDPKTTSEYQRQLAVTIETETRRRAEEQEEIEIDDAALAARGTTCPIIDEVASTMDRQESLDSSLPNQEDKTFLAPPNEKQTFIDRINQSSAASAISDQLTVAAATGALEGTLGGVPVKYVTKNGKRLIQVQERTLEQQRAALSAQQAKDEEGAPTWRVSDNVPPKLSEAALWFVVMNELENFSLQESNYKKLHELLLQKEITPALVNHLQQWLLATTRAF